MSYKMSIIAILAAVFFTSCVSQHIQNKDVAADQALGTSGLDQEAAEVQSAIQEAQADHRREQQQSLERQITDPDFR